MICKRLCISHRTIQNWENRKLEDKRKGAEKSVHNRFSEEEEDRIISVSCSDKNKDKTPYEIVAELAENGEYIGSVRSIYRVLRRRGVIIVKPKSRKNKSGDSVEIKAESPDQIYSWDISYLKRPIRGLYYYLYMFMDIWSKEIMGWKVYEEESGINARDLFNEIASGKITNGIILHSDNGGPMRSSTLRGTLEELGVIQSFSRPSVSNDNAFSESLFSTIKRNAGYPKSFNSIEEAEEWMSRFVNWYNKQHRHSSLDYVTPYQRRSGEYKEIFEKRNRTFTIARKEHPERWTGNTKYWQIKDEVFLKKPNRSKKAA